ncbi:MAG: hypothetical protein KAR35_02020 [Candidatus Heimdallarchaeota archaeon]|nr:hypothetical protein [Candidatus Heimdallarchaeota archaeon]MCK5048130.1 hypothetical protein [Candidatus Heimdallarchaeota archaeon]
MPSSLSSEDFLTQLAFFEPFVTSSVVQHIAIAPSSEDDSPLIIGHLVTFVINDITSHALWLTDPSKAEQIHEPIADFYSNELTTQGFGVIASEWSHLTKMDHIDRLRNESIWVLTKEHSSSYLIDTPEALLSVSRQFEGTLGFDEEAEAIINEDTAKKPQLPSFLHLRELNIPAHFQSRIEGRFTAESLKKDLTHYITLLQLYSSSLSLPDLSSSLSPALASPNLLSLDVNWGNSLLSFRCQSDLELSSSLVQLLRQVFYIAGDLVLFGQHPSMYPIIPHLSFIFETHSSSSLESGIRTRFTPAGPSDSPWAISRVILDFDPEVLAPLLSFDISNLDSLLHNTASHTFLNMAFNVLFFSFGYVSRQLISSDLPSPDLPSILSELFVRRIQSLANPNLPTFPSPSS